MRIASVLTPLSDYNLRLASQCGVEDIVIRFPGLDYQHLIALRDHIASFGLRVTVVEGYLPIENIKLGTPARDEEIAQMKTLIRNMGAAGIPILCYNFMAGSDWTRTSFTERERGGALVSGFDLDALNEKHISPTLKVTSEQLWANLEYFLAQILPVAEESGVTLTMHPDDPPIPSLLGAARIMHTVESFERLMALAPSPHNAICFCQGTFAEMGVDIPATIH
ncbi:MAG: mannonate dehydratase, partial [Abditibacteriales bacterium]|nr:mannonate dehydratase [Abditibacteriales bacterium]